MYNNKIVNELCEETILPHLKDQGYPPVYDSCTWARSNAQKYSGAYSFLLTKTVGAGGAAANIFLHPATAIDKLYGIIPGQTYIFRTKSYVPAGTTPAHVCIFIGLYYDASWHYSLDYASLNDTWEELKIIQLVPSNTTGATLGCQIHSNADLNDKAYFDEIKVHDYNRLIGY